jgi:hypothetical protein
MRDSQALTIMLYAARIDPRLGTPGEEDGRAWAPLLEGLDPGRCLAAVDRHYRESNERIMPSDIRKLARTMTDMDQGPVELSPLVAGGSARVEEPHAGEVLCPACALVHRPDESCGEFAANRRAKLPRPIGQVVREITDAPEEGLSGRPSAVHERALARARAERGNVPWKPPVDVDAPEDAGPPREERDPDSANVAPSVQDLQALRDAAARRCRVCSAVFLDAPDGRTAHRTVFGHDPRSDVPQPPTPEGVTADA